MRKKAQRGGSGGRILLLDNTGGGVVTLRPITFPCVADGFKLDCLTHT